ncbi:response regulator transcription factor [Caproiciproducens sp. LBM24188]
MLRLIIADDEKIIREAISRLIRWEDYGIELAGLCKDGIETFDMICDEYPDIVLTDIKMPGLDGLNLIKKVHEIDSDIEFIILSGFGEFEFAKQAMEYGVKYYLLKPINEKGIIDAIQKAKVDIMKKRALKKLQYEKELLSNQFQTVLQKQFLMESLTFKADWEDVLSRYAGLFEFQHNMFALYYVSFLEEHNLTEFTNRLNVLCTESNLSICFNIIYVKNTAIFILNTESTTDLTRFNATILSWKFPRMAVHPTLQQLTFSNIKELFQNLIPKVQRYEKIYFIDESNTPKGIYNYSSIIERADLVSKEICENIQNLSNSITECFSSVVDTEFAKTLASKLTVQTIVNTNQMQPHDLSQFFKEINDCGNVDEVAERTAQELKRLISENMKDDFRHKDYIKQTLNYVNNHLSDPNLSLKWISENYIFMNVNYLSKQFYKETGEKFSAYLNRIRMEKAENLITKHGLTKVSSIAKQVGFGDNSQYFSQAFKKHTGLTPSEYIEQKRGQDSGCAAQDLA